ncbi:hypothetical protein ETD86_07295 [Nonomuraea turkmeniaca]|uniref:Uncharacterized protein n=1 Tax=Nonomuraea turkmeniaca TaxID=103838 RepID=A0A5S4FSI8_9ACTN|nr:hypothetical protein [Nonomuraea turkmeniaca]TMR23638.1 hypothetical protein ETD86_07295 [Nonomuraea turkmeniaca]
MLADEMRRSQPHEVPTRGARSGMPPQDRDESTSARTVHRLRRIRQVSVQAITEIDQALRHRAS